MFPIHDQVSVATRRQLEAQLATLTALTDKTLDSIEALTALHITAVRTAMDESADLTQDVLEAQSPQQLAAALAGQLSPAQARCLAYGRHLAGIGAGLRAEMALAMEAQAQASLRQFSKLLGEFARKGPIGSGELAAVAQAMADNGGKAFTQMQRNVRLADEAVAANLNALQAQAALAG